MSVNKVRVIYQVNGIRYEAIGSDNAEFPKDANAWQKRLLKGHDLGKNPDFRLIKVEFLSVLGLSK
jgi:hypothetical protein